MQQYHLNNTKRYEWAPQPVPRYEVIYMRSKAQLQTAEAAWQHHQLRSAPNLWHI